MLFDLVVSKFENLKTIRERGLCCLCLSEVVYNSLISIGLLDVIVVEVDNGVSVREHLSLHSIVEDDLFLSVFVDSLNLPIISNYLLDHLHVGGRLAVVVRRELHVVIFSIIFFLTRLRVLSWHLDAADILLLSVVFFMSDLCLGT